MRDKRSSRAIASKGVKEKPPCVVDAIVEKKLEEIATVLYSSGMAKSKLYEEIITMVERCLFKTALKNTNNVKSAAAAYLGINRNTFQNKMIKLGLNGQKE
jgi:DNA-binding protein Fis